MKTRRAEVDLLRAFGIILMVLGHVGLGNQFSQTYEIPPVLVFRKRG